MTPLRFALIGDPVAHSKSPVMHAAALRAMHLPHTYEAVRTTEAELPGRVQALRDGVFAGLNVTVPHKTRVLALVDEVHPSAAVAGAANTLVRGGGGRIVAHNTDVPALQAELRVLLNGTAAGDVREAMQGARRALVLGSGGAARAAVQALDDLGVAEVVARARRSEAIFELRPGVPAWQAWAGDRSSEEVTAIVVQATSAGMTGAGPGEAAAAVVAWEALPAGAIAFDVVYAPSSTPFLVAAGARRLQRAGGLGMLARQGALALELWTGLTPPLAIMLAALTLPGPQAQA